MKDKEEKNMYKEFITIDGILEDVKDINRAIAEQTGDIEDFFGPESEDWRAWVEWKDGKTIILAEEA